MEIARIECGVNAVMPRVAGLIIPNRIPVGNIVDQYWQGGGNTFDYLQGYRTAAIGVPPSIAGKIRIRIKTVTNYSIYVYKAGFPRYRSFGDDYEMPVRLFGSYDGNISVCRIRNVDVVNGYDQFVSNSNKNISFVIEPIGQNNTHITLKEGEGSPNSIFGSGLYPTSLLEENAHPVKSFKASPPGHLDYQENIYIPSGYILLGLGYHASHEQIYIETDTPLNEGASGIGDFEDEPNFWTDKVGTKELG